MRGVGETHVKQSLALRLSLFFFTYGLTVPLRCGRFGQACTVPGLFCSGSATVGRGTMPRSGIDDKG